MTRLLASALACALIGCASTPKSARVVDTDAETGVAARTYERDIELVRPLAYATVIDLGLEITESDALGDEQWLLAQDGTRGVRIELQRIGPDATWMYAEASDAASEGDAELAQRIADGLVRRLSTAAASPPASPSDD